MSKISHIVLGALVAPSLSATESILIMSQSLKSKPYITKYIDCVMYTCCNEIQNNLGKPNSELIIF
jgi:hypothetical protein